MPDDYLLREPVRDGLDLERLDSRPGSRTWTWPLVGRRATFYTSGACRLVFSFKVTHLYS